MTKREPQHTALKARANAQLMAAKLVNHHIANNDWDQARVWHEFGQTLNSIDMTPGTEDSDAYRREESPKIVMTKEQKLMDMFDRYLALATKRIIKELGSYESYEELVRIANIRNS